MSDKWWTHIYGLISVIAFIIAVKPVLSQWMIARSSARKAKRRSELEKELDAFEAHLADDVHSQRFFRSTLAAGCFFLSVGAGIVLLTLVSPDRPGSIFRHIVLIIASGAFGGAIGSFLALRMRMHRLLDPDSTRKELIKRIEANR